MQTNQNFSDMILSNPLEGLDGYDKFNSYISDYINITSKFSRYSGIILNYGIDPKDYNLIALDLPAMIIPENPIKKFGNPVVAIVGESPKRDTVPYSFPSLSIGVTFGQHSPKYKDNPRVYDLLIDWYLERGFSVYITNYYKERYYLRDKEDENSVSSFVITDNEKTIEILKREFKMCHPNHIIWLSDDQDKKFVYGESCKDFFTDWTVFPHPSGANNKKWTNILKGNACTKENKVEYITSHANVLYLDADGQMKSTIPD